LIHHFRVDIGSQGLADQNASLKTVIDNLTKLDHQRQVQLEQHR
jgi:hypothetical protein